MYCPYSGTILSKFTLPWDNIYLCICPETIMYHRHQSKLVNDPANQTSFLISCCEELRVPLRFMERHALNVLHLNRRCRTVLECHFPGDQTFGLRAQHFCTSHIERHLTVKESQASQYSYYYLHVYLLTYTSEHHE